MTKPKNKGGRPRINIDWEQFDKLCAMQCPLSEIASWFECCEDTIETSCKREKGMSFSDYFEAHRGRGKIALRKKQYDVAMTGNVHMLVWLGKQYLGQTDKSAIEHSGNIGNWSELAAKAGLNNDKNNTKE